MKTFKANEYSNRVDLERAIKAEVGTNVEKNEMNGHLVEGTRKELKKLFLTDETSLWGVRCKITDSPTIQLLKDKHQLKVEKDKPKEKDVKTEKS